MISELGLRRIAKGLKRSLRWPDDQPYSPLAWKVMELDRGAQIEIAASDLGELLNIVDEEELKNVRSNPKPGEPGVLTVYLFEEQQHGGGWQ